MDNLSVLEQLELSEKEIKIYRTLLSLGSSSVALIAKETGIKRPSTYFSLSRLTEKGLVSQTEGGKREVFQAEDPETLLRIAKHKAEEVKNLEKSIKKLVAHFSKLKAKKKNGLKIRLLESREGLWGIAEDTLKDRKDIYVLGSLQKLYRMYSKDRVYNYGYRRETRRINVKSLNDQNPAAIQEYLSGEFKFIEYRFLPKNIKLDSYFVFYGNKALITTDKEPLTGVIIEDEAIVTALKLMFEVLWKEMEGKHLPNTSNTELST